MMAQEDGFLIDSTRETLTMGYGTYTRIKQYYYYNNFNQLKFLDTYTNKNSFPDTADWQNTGNEYHYYDGQHRITKDTYQSRKSWENDWSYKTKKEYEYSDSTTINTSYSWDFASGNWNNGNTKNIDSLKTPEELESSHLRQYWYDGTGQWENDFWVDTVFLQPDMVDSISETYWSPGDTSFIYNIILRYNYTFYPDTLFIYEFENNYYHYLLSKVYYSGDSLTKYNFTYRFLNDALTDTLFRKMYHYDTEQRLIKYEKADWFPNTQSWFTLNVITYEYNEKGLLVQYDYQSAGTYNRTKYEYNDDDLLWKKIYFSDVHDLTRFTTTYYYYTYTYVNIPEPKSDNFKEIVFYPNPSQSVIHFNGLHNNKKQYQIYDITGRVIQQGSLFNDQHSLDVSNLIPGYYVAVIKSDGKTYQGKFVKY